MKYVEPITWKCKKCKSEQVSDPLREWGMQHCNCSSVALKLRKETKEILGQEELYEEIKNEN